MILGVALVCAAVLLALAVLAALMARSPYASRLIYAACMFVSAASLAAALTYLLFARVPEGLTLPVGLPWLGAHLRLDALSAFFLAVVDLGALNGVEGRTHTAARLASPRPSCCSQSCVGADERRHDQGGRLRLRSDRVRPRRHAVLVVEHRDIDGRRHHARHGRAL